ncbi:FKBP-type peptidyl-prolyl cis-trans isomerase [Carboxylicivirga sp. A043]|uniref:FKBP-type peptidyl-prolyl cis-trans isomerase n=1 Tax=Carboxylicivirga litoralis TaxID=2816963 RepID=UPI0021CB1776|nr:FKBP-type peptidyl-prolyl cis-trans isomerase [Carboxylicivirga sp. A043]MCU4155675.1 FKBP-type peptidyl-prolyl cis-trans isomerase [Carboxylicivirga sp. A043]
MKSFLAFAIAAFILASCQLKSSQSDVKKEDNVIQTASGLQYYYIKKGDGPKVVPGSRVGTYLSLKVKDSVVWNTNELPDSLFTFVADSTRLIKGFTEVSLLLREGDEIVAILPDSLAYGAKGAGDVIPPHATLIYDVFKVVKVEAPYKKTDKASEAL